jgi:competence protein ComEC
MLAIGRRYALAVLLMLATAAGLGAAARTAPPPTDVGGVTVAFDAVAQSDPAPATFGGGWTFVVRPLTGAAAGGAAVAVSAAEHPDLMVGARVHVVGRLEMRPGRLHRRPIAGRVAARVVEVVAQPGGVIAYANALRSRVLSEFPAVDQAGALMRGFLIGDTSAVGATELEDMRRAGLLHFVAVSGGNVAIFLGGVWLLLGLIPMGPRVRAGVGLLGVGLFVLVTRWEPSVLRAGVMAGLLLGGRLAGVPVDAWTAFGGAATLLLLTAPQLIFDVGFQLSALATAGLLLGSHIWSDRRPAPLWRSLGATIAAQLAVTPLLLWHFGSVPAFSAIANVLAAPLVTLGTAAGWGRVFTGAPVLDRGAEMAAHLVLRLADWAAQLPQVGLIGVSGVLGFLVVLRRRTSVAITLAVVALGVYSITPGPPPVPTAVFLDVGQGDAILLRSPGGEVVAVDTGSEPVTYRAALRRHGIGHIDLLILTHSDKDHIGGVAALPGHVEVDHIWYPDFTAMEAWTDLFGDLDAAAAPVAAGTTATVGSFFLEVLGPGRRYAADNDGSVVVWVEVNGRSLLLAGDIEGVAQVELPGVNPDVLLVPHHGSATTDLDWLRETVGPQAVLSYGENTYGHPASEVIDTLLNAPTRVLRTEDGDVALEFEPTALPGAAVRSHRPPWPSSARMPRGWLAWCRGSDTRISRPNRRQLPIPPCTAARSGRCVHWRRPPPACGFPRVRSPNGAV